MKLTIIDRQPGKIIREIFGDTEEDCDEQAVEMDYDDPDLYQWRYT